MNDLDTRKGLVYLDLDLLLFYILLFATFLQLFTILATDTVIPGTVFQLADFRHLNHSLSVLSLLVDYCQSSVLSFFFLLSFTLHVY